MYVELLCSLNFAQSWYCTLKLIDKWADSVLYAAQRCAVLFADSPLAALSSAVVLSLIISERCDVRVNGGCRSLSCRTQNDGLLELSTPANPQGGDCQKP